MLQANVIFQKKSIVAAFFALLVILDLSFTGFITYQLLHPKQIRPAKQIPRTDTRKGSSFSVLSAHVSRTTKTGSIQDSYNQFGLDIFRQLYENNPHENILISPSGVARLLAIFSTALGQSTQEKIFSGLNLGGYTTPEILSELTTTGQNRRRLPRDLGWLNLNTIFVSSRYPLSYAYTKGIQKSYFSQAINIDFNKKNAVNILNQNISLNSGGRVRQVLRRPIDPASEMILFNLSSLNPLWQTGFNPDDNQTREFHINTDEIIPAEFMFTQRDNIQFYENPDLQVVTLPYVGNSGLVFVCILPKTTIGQVIDILSPDTVKFWLESTRPHRVALFMPKFKISDIYDLKGTLSDSALLPVTKSVFDITPALKPGSIYTQFPQLNHFIQMSEITISESGSVKPVATAIDYSRSSKSGNPMAYMEINKPFIFFALDSGSGELLLSGILNNPLTPSGQKDIFD